MKSSSTIRVLITIVLSAEERITLRVESASTIVGTETRQQGNDVPVFARTLHEAGATRGGIRVSSRRHAFREPYEAGELSDCSLPARRAVDGRPGGYREAPAGAA